MGSPRFSYFQQFHHKHLCAYSFCFCNFLRTGLLGSISEALSESSRIQLFFFGECVIQGAAATKAQLASLEATLPALGVNMKITGQHSIKK